MAGYTFLGPAAAWLSRLTIAGTLVVWCFLPSADAEVNQPAIAAAMGIWGYVVGVQLQIAKCREADPANADSYDLAYTTYDQDVGTLLLRIEILLNSEVARAGAPKDFIATRKRSISEALTNEVRQRFETNPSMWLQTCREMPDAAVRHTYEFQPLLERYPDWMRQIDEWR